MINNIAYFPSQAARNSVPVLEAFVDSCRSHKIAVRENSWDCEAAVIWSVLWHGRMKNNQKVFDHYRSLGRPVIIIDVGALYRGTTWKIAVNHITAEGYYGHQINLDWDRPLRLGISLAELLMPNPSIILAAQHKNSLQVSGITSMEDWVNDRITKIRTYTDRPIIVRPHPRSPLDPSRILSGITIENPKKLDGTYDNFDMHFDCHAVVNHNSGPGIQAAIAGSRPVVDASSLAHAVGIQLENIEQPYDADRDQWLVEICHTEYTVEEIRRGRWIKRLEAAL